MCPCCCFSPSLVLWRFYNAANTFSARPSKSAAEGVAFKARPPLPRPPALKQAAAAPAGATRPAPLVPTSNASPQADARGSDSVVDPLSGSHSLPSLSTRPPSSLYPFLITHSFECKWQSSDGSVSLWRPRCLPGQAILGDVVVRG